jgi:uncharacterized membrane protein HdeD (DUF308 family)
MDTQSFREKETKRRSTIRIIYDLTMGVLWTTGGVFLLVNKYLNTPFSFDSLTSTIFGIACLCYGVFRLYRGFSAKKQP